MADRVPEDGSRLSVEDCFADSYLRERVGLFRRYYDKRR